MKQNQKNRRANTLFTLAALFVVLLNFSQLFSAEITINWRQKLDSGMVDDLKFMPGQEQFILSSGQVQKFTEIRSCEDGSILQSYPFGGSQFEFTPDSNKLIFMSGPHIERGELQLRNLSDMSLLTQYQLPKDTELPYSYFEQMAVDPVRPFIYAIWIRRNNNPNASIVKTKILIYHQESLQPIGEITSDSDSSLRFTNIAVSKDGKYLVAMDHGDTKLMVWSLDTRQKIVEKFISDQLADKYSTPADIKFSELNTDKIYFTGQFYKEKNETLEGLCIFSISENRIIDSTFALPPNRIAANTKITIFANETKYIGPGYGNLQVINLSNKTIEFSKQYTELDYVGTGEMIYNENKKFFVGLSHLIDKFQYQPNTSVSLDNPKEIIYPNPTSGYANIPVNCINLSKYEIYNSDGLIINTVKLTGVMGNLLTIDFTSYPVGVYFVKLYCDKTVSQYQIVKEG